MRFPALLAAALAFVLALSASHAQERRPAFTRTEDVIYGRKYGTALTLDVFQPEQPNQAAAIIMISGGWFSSHDGINPAFFRSFLDRGYTIFARDYLRFCHSQST